MRVTTLTILHGGVVVRAIKFKNGLNLILDKPTSAATQSGNNVGKTTVLRLIDFCLGSEGDDIWQDSEFKNTINKDVYDFLHGTVPVSIALLLESAKSRTHSLRRTFKDSEPSFFVDDVPFKNINLYRTAVKELLFQSQGTKPTLRQLAPKFVRSSQVLMSKTLKFLGDYASEVDYEAIHLFLFGFFAVDVLEERPRLTRNRKKLNRDLQALQRTRKEGEIEQLLLHLKREIEELTLSTHLRGEVPEIAAHANRVTGIRADAANVVATLARIDGEIAATEMTIQELASEFSNIDRHSIESIYREAGKYLHELHHDWNELTDFVQSLRTRKERFLLRHTAQLHVRATALKEQIADLQTRESKELQTLMSSRAFSQALEVRADLQVKLKTLGSLEQDLQDIKDLKEHLALVDTRLDQTKTLIEEGKVLLKDRVRIFNKYFSELSKTLYGEQYLLHFEESSRGALVFQLSAVGSNVGTGKKLSQTAAFDLAYVKFLRETAISFPRFVCHDGVESIHANQLRLLLETAAAMDGQLILATLRDKLPAMPAEFIAENTALELSQDDRLFRI